MDHFLSRVIFSTQNTHTQYRPLLCYWGCQCPPVSFLHLSALVLHQVAEGGRRGEKGKERGGGEGVRERSKGGRVWGRKEKGGREREEKNEGKRCEIGIIQQVSIQQSPVTTLTDIPYAHLDGPPICRLNTPHSISSQYSTYHPYSAGSNTTLCCNMQSTLYMHSLQLTWLKSASGVKVLPGGILLHSATPPHAVLRASMSAATLLSEVFRASLWDWSSWVVLDTLDRMSLVPLIPVGTYMYMNRGKMKLRLIHFLIAHVH